MSSSHELHHKLFVEAMEGCDSKDKELMKFVKSKLTEIRTESLKRSSSTSTSNIVDKTTSNSAKSKKSKQSSSNSQKIICSLKIRRKAVIESD